MTVDAAVCVAMTGNDPLKFNRSLGQFVNGERHILYETTRTIGSHATDGRKDAPADGPVAIRHLVILCERKGLIKRVGGYNLRNSLYIVHQHVM